KIFIHGTNGFTLPFEPYAVICQIKCLALRCYVSALHVTDCFFEAQWVKLAICHPKGLEFPLDRLRIGIQSATAIFGKANRRQRAFTGRLHCPLRCPALCTTLI